MTTGDRTSERREGPTPNGGAYSVAFFQDAQGRPVPKALATQVEIVEFDEQDVSMFRTYGNLYPTEPVVTEDELATLTDDELIALIQVRTGHLYGTAAEILIVYRGGPPEGESMDAVDAMTEPKLTTGSVLSLEEIERFEFETLLAMFMARTGASEAEATPIVSIMKNGPPDDPITL